jgi:Spy/CpxP family protein refolding chaperone
MKRRVIAFVLCFAPIVSGVAIAIAATPYAGQQAREIKSLSADEIDAYLSGKGMGMAKPAELNGYPGPAHVLELASQLKLTPEQRAKTQALFDKMEVEAKRLGASIVDEERNLDQLFAAKTVTPQSLQTSLSHIAVFQVRLRNAHLSAHLEQAQILTPEQSAEYASQRGYGGTASGAEHKHQ